MNQSCWKRKEELISCWNVTWQMQLRAPPIWGHSKSSSSGLPLDTWTLYIVAIGHPDHPQSETVKIFLVRFLSKSLAITPITITVLLRSYPQHSSINWAEGSIGPNQVGSGPPVDPGSQPVRRRLKPHTCKDCLWPFLCPHSVRGGPWQLVPKPHTSRLYSRGDKDRCGMWLSPDPGTQRGTEKYFKLEEIFG